MSEDGDAKEAGAEVEVEADDDLKPRKRVATFRTAREQQNRGAISAPSRKHGKLLVARIQALNIASRTVSILWNQIKLVPLEMMIMVWTKLLLCCVGHQTGLQENRQGMNQSPPNTKPGGR